MSKKLQDLDRKAQISQAMLWLAEDEDMRAWFLAQPEAVFAAWADAGHIMSPDAQRQMLDSIEKRGFEATLKRYRVDRVDRSADGPLDIPAPVSMGMAMVDTSDQVKGLEESGAPPARLVNTGFADAAQPQQPIDAYTPLATGADYYFWFEVGELATGAIDVEPVELPIDKLPPEARLQVALFGFDGGLALTPGADVGEIKIEGNGRVRVIKPAAQPDILAGDELLTRRLFFPVSAPTAAGSRNLRCNIYYQQTLVQSHLVTVQVTANPAPQDDVALKTQADYTLSHTLDGAQLQGMGQTRLSLMLNDNGNGTHGFRFFGEKEFKNDAALGEGELSDLIAKARGAMRQAAWGDEEDFAAGKVYRYGGRPNPKRLTDDLVRFAIRGYRFYDALITKLAGDADPWDLADLMLKPGQVQIASKESARLVVPAAMFYDYPLDDGRPDHTLCPEFLQALKSGAALAETACFQGNCPSYDEETVVCPSGFWGFRHSLGFPVSIGGASDAPPEIPSSDKPQIDVGMYPDFPMLPQHLKKLRSMGYEGDSAQTRDATLDMLKSSDAQVVYFYCHGGVTNENIPFLQVDTNHQRRFTRSNLRSKRIRWEEPRPLVFINGCHTTALSPDVAIDLVSGFVATSHAAGVVGTEITIFEPIAVSFAEECFDRFLRQRQTLGEAIRGARIKMLQEGNPLGLVYIPYAMAGLKLANRS